MQRRYLTLSLATIVVGFIFCSGALVAHADITMGMVGHWMLDDGGNSMTAADATGNGNTGTLQGSPLPFWSTGVVGSGSLSFSGVNNDVNITHTSGLPIYSTTTPYSVSLWFRPVAVSGSSETLFEEDDEGVGNNNPVFRIFINASSNTYRVGVQIRDNSGNYLADNAGDRLDLRFSNFLGSFDNTWHNLVWVDNQGTAQLYIDGIADPESQSRGWNYNIISPIPLDETLLGSLQSTAGYYYDGFLDDVRVYDKTLTSSDASALYALGTSGVMPTSTISVSNSGHGTINSNPAGINACTGSGGNCSASFTSGAFISLTATPDPGYGTTWSGCGSTVSGNTCTFATTTNSTVNVSFTGVPPTNLTGSAISANQVTLSWKPITSNGLSPDGYTIYRDNIAVGSASTTWYEDRGLLPSTAYTYAVSAYYNSNGSNPATSSPFTVTTKSSDQTGIIPPDRLANWTPGVGVGVPGGIPTRIGGAGNCIAPTCIDVTKAPYNVDPSSISTTGSISDGSTQLTVADATGFNVSDPIIIDGASGSVGPSGAHLSLSTTITAINGNVITLQNTASFSTTTAGVHHDSFAAVQQAANDADAAIKNATAPYVVIYIPAGTYYFSNAVSLPMNLLPSTGHSNITFRGDGDATLIYAYNGGFYFASGGSPEGSANVIENPNKNDSWITVDQINTLMNFDPFGTPVPYFQATTTNCASGYACYAPVYGDGYLGEVSQSINDPNLPVMSVNGFDDGRSQMTLIKGLRSKNSCNGSACNQVEIDPSLLFDLPSSLFPSISINSSSQYSYIGFENMKINLSGGPGAAVEIGNCEGCWVTGVTALYTQNYGIELLSDIFAEISHDTAAYKQGGTGESTAGFLLDGTYSSLIQNNVGYGFTNSPDFMMQPGAGNVISYNMMEEWYDTHGIHSSYNLFEGNVSNNLEFDGYFGSESEETIFRNWVQYMIQVKRFSRNFSIVGNILGYTGALPVGVVASLYDNGGNGDSTAPGADNSVNYSNPAAYEFGLPNIGNPSFDGNYVDLYNNIPWLDMSIEGTVSSRIDDLNGDISLTTPSGSLAANDWPIEMIWASSTASGGIAVRGQMTAGTPSGDTFPILSENAAYGSPFPPVGTTNVQLWPGPNGFQEFDLDVAGSVDVADNWNSAMHAIAPNEDLGDNCASLPTSLYLTGKPTWFGNLSWPPYDPCNPRLSDTDNSAANRDAIPAGYRYDHNGADPAGIAGAPTTFDVVVTTSGSGSVVSDVGGVSCSNNAGTCTSGAVNNGTLINLTATPSSGSTFASWSGGCSGTGTCTVGVNTLVTATFTSSAGTVGGNTGGSGNTGTTGGVSGGSSGGGGGGGSPSSYTLTIIKTGIGLGIATSTPIGIDCGVSCTLSVVSGTSVILNALPQYGSHLASWTGCDSIATSVCNVAITGNKTISIDFEPGAATTTVINIAPLIVSIPGCPVGFTCIAKPVSGCPTGMICTPSLSVNLDPPISCGSAFTFTRSLTLSSTGADVKALQQFLNANGYAVAISGNGSPNHETTYFGLATQSALARYQRANGITPSSGYFGPKTQAFIAKLPESCSSSTEPAQTTPVISTPAVTTSSSSTSYTFTTPLKIGSTGAEVKQLQIFLNDNGFTIAAGGNGSRGNETTYYGQATASAVSRFQMAHASEILAPYGLTRGTGNFGVATMRVVNSME